MSTLTRYLAGLLILLTLGAGAYAVYSYRAMTTRVAVLEQTAAQYGELKTRFDAFSKEVGRRRDTDQTIRDSRTAVSQELEKTSREDPTVADFLHTPLPDGMRQAYRRARSQPVLNPNGH